MNRSHITRQFIHRKLPLLIFIMALALFLLSMAGNSSESDTARVAKTAKTRIEDRVSILDTYINKVLNTETDEDRCLIELPEDMVIYKYVNDSLKSWANQFSVLNDDISNRMVFQRLTNLKNRIGPYAYVVGENSSVLPLSWAPQKNATISVTVRPPVISVYAFMVRCPAKNIITATIRSARPIHRSMELS